MLAIGETKALTKRIPLKVAATMPVANAEPSFDLPTEPTPHFQYEIQIGDSLSQIFERLGIGYSDMMGVMETDMNYLALDTLQPGDLLRFWIDPANRTLQMMELEFTLADRVRYTRNSDNAFDFADVSIEGDWVQEALFADIYGSFSQSANRTGLSSYEIEQVQSLLKEKVNFARDLRAGDRFEVVRLRQFIDGQATGKRKLEAIKIYNGKRLLSAYLHTDGQYYDALGNSLQRAFQRYPVDSRWRLSSHFNPRRLHPVTKRVAPHNGTDFATPIGTPVMSTGDGTVIRTTNHPYAGKYVVIEHSSKYKTRYLHLDQIKVRRGQKVARGEVIGLSGKTGRVTGAHLHYELIANGRPVDAMKANIPMASSVPKNELKSFIAKRDTLDALFGDKETSLAMVSD
nr:peptidoglycan DD-metalloendopeptidase family protein [Vibrio agarilyticus]